LLKKPLLETGDFRFKGLLTEFCTVSFRIYIRTYFHFQSTYSRPFVVCCPLTWLSKLDADESARANALKTASIS